MRGVGVRGSLLAGVGAVAILLSVESSGAVAAEETAALSPEASQPDDYYTRRARHILKAEKAAGREPHPLAASYPGMDIVVCEAGCRDRRGAHVVFARRPVAVTEASEGTMVPTSASGAPALSLAGAACIGGCYDDSAGPGLPVLARRPVPVQPMTLPPRDKLSPVR